MKSLFDRFAAVLGALSMTTIAVHAENLLPNPGFEAGMEGWKLEFHQAADGNYELVRTPEAVDGEHLVRVTLPSNSRDGVGHARLFCNFVPVDASTVTVSFYARSVTGTNRVIPYTFGEGPHSQNRRLNDSNRPGENYGPPAVELTREWKRYSLTRPMKNKIPFDFCGVFLKGDGIVEIDALQFETGSEATSYRAADRPQLGFSVDQKVMLVYPGTPVNYELILNMPGKPDRTRGNLILVRGDHTRREIEREVLPYDLSRSSRHIWRKKWTAPELTGLYHFHAWPEEDPDNRVAFVLGVVPEQPAYGVGRYNLFSAANEGDPETLRKLGMSSIRLFGPSLDTRNNEVDRDNWYTDALVDRFLEAGITPFYCLEYPQGGDFNRYLHFVKRVATRYRDKVKVYELLNEPYYVYPSGAKYTAAARLIARVIRENNPEAIIYGICGNPQLPPRHRLGRFIPDSLDAGILDFSDGISLHPYSFGGHPEFWQARGIRPILATLQTMGKEKLPIWDSESGGMERCPWQSGGEPPVHTEGYPNPGNMLFPALHSQIMVRTHLMRYAFGIGIKSQFTPGPRPWTFHTMFQRDHHRSATLQSVAYAVMSSILRDCRPGTFFATDPRGTFLYTFGRTQGGGELWCVWNFHYHHIVPFEFRGAKPEKVLDLYGRPVEVKSVGEQTWQITSTAGPTYLFFSEVQEGIEERVRVTGARASKFTASFREPLPLVRYLTSFDAYVDELTVPFATTKCPVAIDVRIAAENAAPGETIRTQIGQDSGAFHGKYLQLHPSGGRHEGADLRYEFEAEDDAPYEVWIAGTGIPAYDSASMEQFLSETPDAVWREKRAGSSGAGELFQFRVNGKKWSSASTLSMPGPYNAYGSAKQQFKWFYIGDIWTNPGKNTLEFRLQSPNNQEQKWDQIILRRIPGGVNW